MAQATINLEPLSLNVGLALLAVSYYVLAVLGSAFGYHRMLTHQAFRLKGGLNYFFVILGLPAGTPLQWVANHRAHHLYTDTPDLRFVIDFLPGTPQVLVSSPCSGHGFKFTSVLGELAASMSVERPISVGLDFLRLSRFSK